MARMKSKHGVQSISYMGSSYSADKDGIIEVPEGAVASLLSHGFEPIADAEIAAAGAGNPKVSLEVALTMLDPENEAHWVKTSGKPDVNVLKELTGNDAITRKAVDAIAPDFTRELAQQVKEVTEAEALEAAKAAAIAEAGGQG
jgi:hypothetical protein